MLFPGFDKLSSPKNTNATFFESEDCYLLNVLDVVFPRTACCFQKLTIIGAEIKIWIIVENN